MRYLSAEDLLVIHALVVDETGGSHGVRDPQLLASIAHKPRTSFGGSELYRGVFKKAAALLEAIANYHVFVDGNKRTALVAASRFLAMNGYDFSAENKEAESTVLAVATKRLDADALAAWLKEHGRKRRR